MCSMTGNSTLFVSQKNHKHQIPSNAWNSSFVSTHSSNIKSTKNFLNDKMDQIFLQQQNVQISIKCI
jgi:hypothetical protein